jgi:hypothetical protein
VIWAENNFYEPENNSVGESIMIEVKTCLMEEATLEDESTLGFTVKLSSIHTDILNTAKCEAECESAVALKEVIRLGFEAYLRDFQY